MTSSLIFRSSFLIKSFGFSHNVRAVASIHYNGHWCICIGDAYACWRTIYFKKYTYADYRLSATRTLFFCSSPFSRSFSFTQIDLTVFASATVELYFDRRFFSSRNFQGYNKWMLDFVNDAKMKKPVEMMKKLMARIRDQCFFFWWDFRRLFLVTEFSIEI